MANIKDIIAPVELITEDTALEKHLFKSILTNDHLMLEVEQKAVVDALDRYMNQLKSLKATKERMQLANDKLKGAAGKYYLYSKEDMAYIDEQIYIASRNCEYYNNRINIIDDILGETFI